MNDLSSGLTLTVLGMGPPSSGGTTVGGTTTTDSFLYAYLQSPDANAGKVASVTLRQQVNAGGFTAVRKAEYAYYEGVESFGTLGDLKTVAVRDGSGTVLDTTYYRYHTGPSSVGYSGGIAAWWWVGSAAIGSIVLALWIGPAMRKVAAAHDLRTVGDYLEHRYSSPVRALASGILWVGSLFILAGQLWAMGSIMSAV